MNLFERIKKKVEYKTLNTNKDRSRILAEELNSAIDDISKRRECQDIIASGADYFKSQERKLEKRIPKSEDEKKDFTDYLNEAKEEIKELVFIYNNYGFSKQFEWKMTYIDCIAEKLYYMTRHIYPNAIQKEDKYTKSGQPADHVVKNLDKETKKWLRDIQEIIDYTYQSIKEKDEGKILNGTATLSLIAMSSAALIDKKHGRQFSWK